MHWPIEPEALRPLIPPQLELDLFEGTAYVGLVPFTMTGVRPVGLPAVAGAFELPRDQRADLRPTGGPRPRRLVLQPRSGQPDRRAPGPEAVPSALPLRAHVPGARAHCSRPTEPTSILYAGTRHWPGPLPASYAIRATPIGPVQPAQPGTLEHFLVERYILYTDPERSALSGPGPPHSLSSSISKTSLARRNSFGRLGSIAPTRLRWPISPPAWTSRSSRFDLCESFSRNRRLR